MLECAAANWAGGNDWQPFRRAEIPVFGIHTGDERRLGGNQNSAAYLAGYRMLTVFLALADDALATETIASSSEQGQAASSSR